MKEREQTALRCRNIDLQNKSTGFFFLSFFEEKASYLFHVEGHEFDTRVLEHQFKTFFELFSQFNLREVVYFGVHAAAVKQPTCERSVIDPSNS